MKTLIAGAALLLGAFGAYAVEKVFEDMKKHGIGKVALLSETSGFAQPGKSKPKASPGNTVSHWSPMKLTARKIPT